MTRYVWTVAVVAVLFICVGAMGKDCSECHKLQLTGKDLSAWRADTAQWQIVHHLMAHHAGAVDQERATVGHAAVCFHIVSLANFVLDVGYQRVTHLADAAVIDRCILPRQMGKVRVN